MTNYKNKCTQIYRSRKGVVLGLCKGLSNHYDIPVFWLRLAVVVIAMTTTIWPAVLGYVILAIVFKPEPVIPFVNEDENEFYDSYSSSRSMGLHRLKRKFDNLNSRIHRMEDVVTSKEYKWNEFMKD